MYTQVLGNSNNNDNDHYGNNNKQTIEQWLQRQLLRGKSCYYFVTSWLTAEYRILLHRFARKAWLRRITRRPCFDTETESCSNFYVDWVNKPRRHHSSYQIFPEHKRYYPTLKAFSAEDFPLLMQFPCNNRNYRRPKFERFVWRALFFVGIHRTSDFMH